jgi:hypothetical protein
MLLTKQTEQQLMRKGTLRITLDQTSVRVRLRPEFYPLTFSNGHVCWSFVLDVLVLLQASMGWVGR